MTPYVFLFASFLLAYFALELGQAGGGLSFAGRWLLLLPLFIFAIVYAGHIGTDTDQYGYLYSTSEDFPVEPGFSLMMTGAKHMGISYLGFTKLLAVLQIILLASITKRLRDPLFFLLFYMGSFFLNFHFNGVRNSLALMLIGAIYVRLRRPSIVALISASLIHYSSVMTLGLQRLAVSKRQFLAIAGVVIGSAVLGLLWAHPELAGDQLGALSVYQGYLGQEYESKSIYPALLLKLAVVWICYKNGGSRFYMVTYAVLVVLVHLVSPILSRISDLVLFLVMLDFCLRHRLQHYRAAALSLTMILVAAALLIPWNDCQNGGVDEWCLSGPARQAMASP